VLYCTLTAGWTPDANAIYVVYTDATVKQVQPLVKQVHLWCTVLYSTVL